ncbi:histidine kinase [Sulfurifustis variabilis]|uniref:histidine kinase n=1 Tax=Sulfurifustis variabilis TaxID=1675686 RepID=A0A1B4V7Y2_9GAMM|nr:ATP-binding protein [Sulfurifustis variabilis]BAU48742.1 histidine kinase [Sulfurifustis variabilis]
MISLRRRLLVILLALFATAWVVLAAFSYRNARHEIEELFDAELAQSARVLLALTQHELDEPGEMDVGAELGAIPADGVVGHRYEKKIAFQVWLGDRLLLRSPSAPETPLAQAPGFGDRTIGGNPWRVFALHGDREEVRVEVGEREDVRNELVRDIVRDLLWPFLLTLPVLALLIWTGVGRGLAPLKRTATEIGRRSPHQLDPLPLGGAPTELRPVVDSLNKLLARLDDALESERRFTANASHELRTPLAGLKAQAQVAARTASDAERTQALAQLVRGVDRATRLVEQMLTLARLDPGEAATRYELVKLAPLLGEVLAEYGATALDKGIELGLAEGAEGTVLADRAALEIMLRNLIDNAIRYTPGPGHVEVGAHGRGHEVVLWVADTGPGIPAAERARVFDRFYRVGGTDAAGCGLGLSIVRRIALLHGAQVELGETSAAGGLRVEVRFPGSGGRTAQSFN